MVHKRVASGRYGSASEVVREALRLLEEWESERQAGVEQLRREVLIGLKARDSGKSVAFDRKVAEEIKAEGRRRKKK